MPDEDQSLNTLEVFRYFDINTTYDLAIITPLLDKMDLSLLDYMSIRDLIEVSVYPNDIPLIVILIAMFSALQEGNLCLDLDKDRCLDQLPKFMQEDADKIIDDFLSGLSENRYHRLIAKSDNEYTPLIFDESGDKRLLYFQKYYVYENRLKKQMETFLNITPSQEIPESKTDDVLEEIYSDLMSIRVGPYHKPMIKDTEQVNALKLALTSPFTIISGGPGTGKTSLMVNILRCCVRLGIRPSRIILGAPTGRAAQRITETLQSSIISIKNPTSEDLDLLHIKASTLHKILGYRRYKQDFHYRKTNPLPAELVIIDEVSMVDVVMMDNLLQAVDPSKTRLILLGDKDQLPSVEAGAVFSEMVPDGNRAVRFKDRLIILQNVYRAEANLFRLATQINQGALPSFSSVPFDTALSGKSDQWTFSEVKNIDQWRECLYQWVTYQYLQPLPDMDKHYMDLITEAEKMGSDELVTTQQGTLLLHRIFGAVERARILSITRHGIFGCTGINAMISDYLTDRFDPSAIGQTNVFHGALIIITRNDYSKDLFNGDAGVIIRDHDRSYRAFFKRSGSYISFPIHLLPPWELAFAITVHKSQGSEFNEVLLAFPEDETNRLLTRQIVYTGITRARNRVLLCGSQAALNTSLQRKIERHSGLVW